MPDTIGPYVIDGVLGEGGMGIVYRAHHRESGEACALKTVKRVDAGRLALLRREIRALGRLRHPGIVRVLGHGVEEGRPWYAMELLEPLTFSGILKSTWSGLASPSSSETEETEIVSSVSLRKGADDMPAWRRTPAGRGRLIELVNVLLHVCPPLALLHSEGLVHCDLKPSNVFLRADGAPVLGDFGLAAHAAGARGRDVLEVERQVRGTYAYMAPEQIRGEQVDARADLYAMGCMLYEAVAGRPPFVGTSRAVVSAHLHSEPSPPSEHVDDLPRELEALILRLLAKEPRRRIGFADDVAQVLASSCDLALPEAPAGVRPYVYRSTLVGRDEDMRRLDRWLMRGREGHGGLLLLAGESGVGKTRLATEVGLAAAGLDYTVVTGQSSEFTDGRAGSGPLEPLLPLLRLVADRCNEHGAAETARLLGDHGRVLAVFERSLANLPGARQWPPLAVLEPQTARRRLFTALADTMLALAQPHGLLLVLDDLQWCDELTAGFLSMVRERLAGSRVLILGTYRTDEWRAGQSLLEAPGVAHMQLSRLGESSVGGMVADMLSMDDPSPSLVGFLAKESEGNPFFVAEYVRAAIAEGILTRDEAGRWQIAHVFALSEDAYAASLPLPSSLRDLVAVRLRGLSPAALAVLDAAAVLGRDVDPVLLEATVPVPGDTAMDGLQELIVRQVLEQGPDGLRFLHHSLREFAYERLEAPRRVALHRRAADAIESLPAATPDLARHAVLASHWSLGDAPEQAMSHHLMAARLAGELHANEQAIEHYRFALAESLRRTTPVAPAELVEVHDGLGDRLSLVGRQVEARESYEAGLALAPSVSGAERLRLASLHRKIGKTFEVHHAHVEALDSLDRALAALGPEAPSQPAEWWEHWIRVRLDRTYVHYWRGAPDLMAAELELVRPHVSHASPALMAGYHECLANLGYRRERYLLSTETVAHVRRAYEASVAAGDPLLVAATLFELGFAQLFHGDLAAAAATLREAHDLARRTGDQPRLVRSLTYLSTCHRRMRDTAAVEREARECLAVAHDTRIGVYIGTSQANLAWVDYVRGRHLEVEDRCRSALDQWHHMDAKFPFYWLAVLPLLAVRFARRDLGEAVRLAERLLAPDQQQLPAALAVPLGEAVAAGAARREQDVRAALTRALGAASQHAYL